MNTSDYFEVVSTDNRVFHLRLKGFWTDKVVLQIGTEFLALFKEAVDSMGGEKFLVLADTSQFKPPSLSAKEVITETMKYAKAHGIYKTVEVMPSAVTRIAIQQAAQESGKDDFRVVVSSVEEGWEKIDELKQNL